MANLKKTQGHLVLVEWLEFSYTAGGAVSGKWVQSL